METLELQDSAKRRGHFALYNCLVLGHTKHNGVQRVYCNPFPGPDNTFYGSHCLDLVMIRPPGIESGGFVVSPDTVWYARVLLLFSTSAATDTGSKSFDCALLSTLETYDDPENGNYINYVNYTSYGNYTDYTYYGNYTDYYAHYVHYGYYTHYFITVWLESVGSRVVYELDYKKPVLYVIPIESILGKLPVVPVGHTGTIPHHLRNVFPGAPGDRRPGAGDGCRMWFVNSWALGWSRDM